jgi:DNA-binding NarL/FixJ family response regulator
MLECGMGSAYGRSLAPANRTCCLAGIKSEIVPMFSAVLKAAGLPALATLARLNVSDLGRLAPDLLVCDLDELDVDALELLRRIRFVLPDCTIVVYTGVMKRTWGRACHLAGANCLLSKEAPQAELAEGVRDALISGCFTDPRFAA